MQGISGNSDPATGVDLIDHMTKKCRAYVCVIIGEVQRRTTVELICELAERPEVSNHPLGEHSGACMTPKPTYP